MILVREEIHLQSAGVVLNAHKSRNKIIRKVTCQKRKRTRQNSPLPRGERGKQGALLSAILLCRAAGSCLSGPDGSNSPEQP